MKKSYATHAIQVRREDVVLTSYVEILETLKQGLRESVEQIGCGKVSDGCKEVNNRVLKTTMKAVRKHIGTDNVIGFVKEAITGSTFVMIFDEKADEKDSRAFLVKQDADGPYIQID